MVRSILVYIVIVAQLVCIATGACPAQVIVGAGHHEFHDMVRNPGECMTLVRVDFSKNIEVEFQEFNVNPTDYIQIFIPRDLAINRYSSTVKPPTIKDIDANVFAFVYNGGTGQPSGQFSFDVKEVDALIAPCQDDLINAKSGTYEVIKGKLPENAYCSILITGPYGQRFSISWTRKVANCNDFELFYYDVNSRRPLCDDESFLTTTETSGFRIYANAKMTSSPGTITISTSNSPLELCPDQFQKAAYTEKEIKIPKVAENLAPNSACKFSISSDYGNVILLSILTSGMAGCTNKEMIIHDGINVGTGEQICNTNKFIRSSSKGVVFFSFTSHDLTIPGTVSIKYRQINSCPDAMTATKTQKSHQYLLHERSLTYPIICRWMLFGYPAIKFTLLYSQPTYLTLRDKDGPLYFSVDQPVLSRGNWIFFDYVTPDNSTRQIVDFLYVIYDRAGTLCPDKTILHSVDSSSFKIADDGFSQNLICDWFVFAPNDEPIHITFNKPNIPSLSCMVGSENKCPSPLSQLTVLSSTILFKFNGVLSINELDIIVQVASGFTDIACPTSDEATSAEQTITFTMTATDKPKPAFYCSWTIVAPVGFYLQYQYSKITLSNEDIFKFYDQSSTAKVPSVSTREEVSKSSVLFFTLRIDQEQSFRDIEIKYKAVDINDYCPRPVNATDEIKYIHIIEKPGIYPHDLTCQWTVTAPMNYEVRFNFEKLTLGPNCEEGELFYFDGTTESGEKFCELPKKPLFRSKQSFIRFRLISKANTFYDVKIKLSYKAEKATVVGSSGIVSSSIAYCSMMMFLAAMVF